MSKMVILVVMAAAFYVIEANFVPYEYNQNNKFAPVNHKRVSNNFEAVRSMQPEDGAQMSSMAVSTSTRNNGEGGTVSQGRLIVNKNGKVYETSFRK